MPSSLFSCLGNAWAMPALTRSRRISRSNVDRFSLAFVNQRHITEANLNEAITAVINAYAQIRRWHKLFGVTA